MNGKANAVLRDVFGYDSFRPLQLDIINSVLRKKDSLVIMPTGGGKSLCYQIPALIFDGLTIVVSPLISLMKDQVEQLKELGVKAVFLNSSLSSEEYSSNLAEVRSGRAKLLYVAPETLMMNRTLNLLDGLKIDCLAIDEAHCISEWGHDFRPEYRQLTEVKSRFSDAVCIALTATATERVREDIKHSLSFQSTDEYIASFNRENLYLQVIPKRNATEQTIQFLRNYPNQSGIIYCFSRRQVDELTEDLAEEGFSVKPYHAGLEDDVRKENQELFIRDDVQIIVATIAFGMGINKPNVRFVVHYDLPKNIESYYQQIGRAGRDGLKAHCLLLFSYGDAGKIRFLINEKAGVEKQVAQMHLDKIIEYCEEEECRRIPILNYFGEEYSGGNCKTCDNCVEGTAEKTDITLAAQKFLSCVFRTDEIFGEAHIIDVLRGSKSQKVLDKGHDKVSTYGIGMEYSKKQWSYFARQFLKYGLIEKDLRFGSLKLTPKAWEVLKNNEPVMGYLKEREHKRKIQDDAYDYDTELFEILRGERKRLADISGLPPYAIFPDKTLVEMATYFPNSKQSLSGMFGVGRVKLDKYGDVFLQFIRDYCTEKGIEEKEKSFSKKLRKSERRRHHEVGEKFNEGSSIYELAEEYVVQQGTIMGHLHKFLMDGFPLRLDGLQNLCKLPEEQQKSVFESFARNGAQLLRPIFDDLEGNIGYDDLRLLQLLYLCEKGEPELGSSPKSAQQESQSIQQKDKSTASRIKSEFPNSFKEWGEQDDILLAERYRAGSTIWELSKLFDRYPGDIVNRLKTLGLK